MSADDWSGWLNWLLTLVYGDDPEIIADDYMCPLGWHPDDELGGES